MLALIDELSASYEKSKNSLFLYWKGYALYLSCIISLKSADRNHFKTPNYCLILYKLFTFGIAQASLALFSLNPTFPFSKNSLCVSVFYHLWVVYCVLQSFIFLNGVLLYRKAVYIALAFSVGLLHILNFIFSPKAFVASAFCVDIILTISVQ